MPKPVHAASSSSLKLTACFWYRLAGTLQTGHSSSFRLFPHRGQIFSGTVSEPHDGHLTLEVNVLQLGHLRLTVSTNVGPCRPASTRSLWDPPDKTDGKKHVHKRLHLTSLRLLRPSHPRTHKGGRLLPHLNPRNQSRAHPRLTWKRRSSQQSTRS